MLKWLINQDRDAIIKLEDISELRSQVVYYNDKIIAFNLMYGLELLGTFDTVVDCLKEVNSVINSKEEFYIVNGYSL